MNLLQFWKYFFMPIRLYTGGGGGGQSTPTTNTTQTSNIPDYAAPYVENMLGAASKQMYTTDANGNQTGFTPYTPYSNNPSDYVAGFSPLQQQAQQGAAGLQTPGQFGMATNMATASGLGSLNAAQQGNQLGGQALGYGAMGAGAGMNGQGIGSQASGLATPALGLGAMGTGIGAQAGQAGANYAAQATDPNAVSQYMSPYMQNVVDYQKGQAIRDYQIGQPAMAAQAVGQGAFGGSRQAIQQAEAQRSLGSQLQGIEATGANNAFNNAQQSQQFGANLGLQGQQTALSGVNAGLAGIGQANQAYQTGLAGNAQALQGAQTGISGVNSAVGAGQYGLQGLNQANNAASNLANIGTQQLGADTSILGTQNQLGNQQQQQQQQIINQGVQNYATAQQYPYMQLSTMSDLLRGLPMQATSTQQYQAAPPIGQQMMGYGLGALGMSKAFA